MHSDAALQQLHYKDQLEWSIHLNQMQAEIHMVFANPASQAIVFYSIKYLVKFDTKLKLSGIWKNPNSSRVLTVCLSW
jgi:hypothetical protein